MDKIRLLDSDSYSESESEEFEEFTGFHQAIQSSSQHGEVMEEGSAQKTRKKKSKSVRSILCLKKYTDYY